MEIISYTDEYKESTQKLITNIQEIEFGCHSKSGRPDLHKIPEIYQRGKSNFWIAVDNNIVVGTIALSDYGEDGGYLERFYVAKELRRQGLGSKLFSTLLEFAKNNGYKEIFLSTQEDRTAAKSFYIKNGFKRIEFLPKDFSHAGDEIFYKLEL